MNKNVYADTVSFVRSCLTVTVTLRVMDMLRREPMTPFDYVGLGALALGTGVAAAVGYTAMRRKTPPDRAALSTAIGYAASLVTIFGSAFDGGTIQSCETENMTNVIARMSEWRDCSQDGIANTASWLGHGMPGR